MTNAPSGDQSVGITATAGSGIAATRASGSDASTIFWYRAYRPPRFEAKTISFPSGDHTGSASIAGSKVILDATFRLRSTTQISQLPVPGSIRLTATRRPSGEMAGLMYSPPNGSLIELKGLAVRSNHVKRDAFPPRAFMNARTPVPDAENCAIVASGPGNASGAASGAMTDSSPSSASVF